MIKKQVPVGAAGQQKGPSAVTPSRLQGAAVAMAPQQHSHPNPALWAGKATEPCPQPSNISEVLCSMIGVLVISCPASKPNFPPRQEIVLANSFLA